MAGRSRVMRLALLAALMLSACATTPPAADAPAERIAYDTNSWGRVVSGWIVGRDGAGTWYERVNDSGQPGPVGPYELRYHEFDVGPAQMAELEAVLANLPDSAPNPLDCEMFRTDDLYGTLRLTHGATTEELAYNQGCRDASYQRFMGQLLAADALVAEWGKAEPVSRTERYASDNTPVSK
ncbi:hypothetical protein [Aurantiacibacter flavus]|uniref:Lipoprotein n=1 Tax=Aurantiacibacter flavus TaxID=3145232 RepID=A0ABV0D077_9SPHN